MIDLNTLKQKSKSESLEYIYKEINDFIIAQGITYYQKYKDIDKLIKNFLDDGDFSFNEYVGLLTATYRFKHKLKNRKLLWEKTIEKADSDNKLVDSVIKTTLNNLE